jgi:hypothetical protein
VMTHRSAAATTVGSCASAVRRTTPEALPAAQRLDQLDSVLGIAKTESEDEIAGLTGRRLLRVGEEDVAGLAVRLAGDHDLEQGRADSGDQVRRSDHELIVR